VRVAAVDIGTNTVRLLVAEVTGAALLPPRVQALDRRTVVTRLGQGVDARGSLADEAVDRTVEVLRGYGDAIVAWQPERVRVAATSATRDAANRAVFLDRAELALGTRPDVIDGDGEARLSFVGTTASLAGAPPYLVIDPGGGSTEFVMGATEPDLVLSIDIGSVRLTERMLPHRPVGPARLAAARSHVDDLLRGVRLPEPPGTVAGVGGTFTSLAAIALGLEVYDAEAVHRSRIDRSTLHELVDRLATLSVDQTAAIPSLDPARAEVLLGGAVVAERCVAHVGVDGVVVSEHDILDGLALSLVA
jgi:exopolyphosphatase/guanosine-5'-triphosphate,3'-diphosphate pyrophosphatase